MGKALIGRRQYAALPMRTGAEPLVMLVTSRGRGRWIIPKGWPEPALLPHELAAKEAFEEAGVVGRAEPRAIGEIAYAKRLSPRLTVRCRADVFLLHVERQLDEWPEKSQRQRRWLAPREAARLVDDPDLAAVILAGAASFHASGAQGAGLLAV